MKLYKKFQCVLLVILILSGALSIGHFSVAANDGLIENAKWPGVGMRSVGGGVYAYNVPEEYNMLIFCDGSIHYEGESGAYQTSDLMFPGGGALFTASRDTIGVNSYGVKVCGGGWSRYSNSDDDDGEKRTVYFKSPWGSAACYCWNFSDGRDKMKKLEPINKNDSNPPEYLNDKYPNFLLDAGCELTIPNSIPLIGGGKVGLDVSSVPLKQENCGHKIKIYIGKAVVDANKDDESVWDYKRKNQHLKSAGFYDTQKKRQKKNSPKVTGFKTLGGFNKNFEGEITGYAEATLDGDFNIISVEGTVGVSLSATAEMQKQFLVYTVPVVVKLKGEAKASGDMVLDFDTKNAKIFMPVATYVVPEITLSAGVGLIEIADLSVYGKATNTVTFDSRKNHIKGELSGEAGISTKLLGFEAYVALLNGSHEYGFGATPNPDTSDNTTTPDNTTPPDDTTHPDNTIPPDNTTPPDNTIPPDDTTHPDNPDDGEGREPSESPNGGGSDSDIIVPPYVRVEDLDFSINRNDNTTSEDWKGSTSIISDGKYVLQSDIYSGTIPKLVTAGDTIMMVWESDISTRTTGNHIAAVYSVYDKNSNTWSTPQIIDDDGTADSNVVVCSDGNNIFVGWMNASKKLRNNVTLEEAAAAYDIKAAVYDPVKKSFKSTTVTNDSHYDFIGGMYAKNGIAYITWINNSNNDPFLKSGRNTITYAQIPYDLSTVSTTAYKNFECPVLSATIGDFGGKTVIAYSVDGDGNNQTVNDAVIYAGYVDEVPTELANGIEFRSNLQINNIFGEDTITWVHNKSLYGTRDLTSIEMLTDENLAISNDYSFITNGRSTTLISVEDCGESTEVVKYSFVDGNWNNPLRITENGKYTAAVSGIFDDNGELMLVYRMSEATVTKEEITELSSLCIQKCREEHNLSLDFCNYDAIAVMTDDKMDVELGIVNNGTFNENAAKVDVLNEQNQVVYSSELELNLNSGDFGRFKMAVPTPSNIERVQKYRLIVHLKDDIDLTDNEEDLVFGYADLGLSVDEAYTKADNEHGVRVRVTNYGGVATNAALYVRNDEFNSRLGMYSLGEIQPGATSYYFIDSQEIASFRNTSDDVRFEVVSDYTENEIGDNASLMHLSEFEDSAIPEQPTESDDSGSTYIVAGTPNLCTASWSPTAAANKMAKRGNMYIKTYYDVEPASSVMLKIVENTKSGSTNWYGDDGEQNISFSINKKCDVTIEYYPGGNKIIVYGSGVVFSQAFDVNSMYAVGNGSGSWLNGVNWIPSSADNKMTKLTNGLYRISYRNVPKGIGYEMKFAADGNWSLNWGGYYYENEMATYAIPNADNIRFNVPYESATVTATIDIMKGSGNAKFIISITDNATQNTTEPTTKPTQVVTVPPTTTEPLINGDVDLNGNFNINDVTVLQKYIASLLVFNNNQLSIADANNDGIVNIKDATKMQKILADLDNW